MRLNSDGVTAGSAGEQPLRFPGQEYAGKWEGTEERYNISRWYRSGWGRYTQADPIGFRGGQNLFRYVANSPIAAIDRFGLFCTKDFVAHYLLGSGQAIDLGDVGLFSAYQNAPPQAGYDRSERETMAKVAKERALELCKDCNKEVRVGFATLLRLGPAI